MNNLPTLLPTRRLKQKANLLLTATLLAVAPLASVRPLMAAPRAVSGAQKRWQNQFANAFQSATTAPAKSAARAAQMKHMEEALAQGANNVNIECFYINSAFGTENGGSKITRYAWTPLHLAAREDALSLADKLIQHRASLEARPRNFDSHSYEDDYVDETGYVARKLFTTETDSFEDAPLFWAVRFNSLKVAQRLIRSGAKLTPVYKGHDDDHVRPSYFSMALRQPTPQMALLLASAPQCSRAQRLDLLVEASKVNKTSVVSALIPKINLATPLDSDTGTNSLHFLSLRGYWQIVELFKARGVALPLESRTRNGETALWLATAQGHTDTATKLLAWGASPDVVVNGKSLWVQAATVLPAQAEKWVVNRPRVQVPPTWNGSAFSVLHREGSWKSLAYLVAELNRIHGVGRWPSYGRLEVDYFPVKAQWYEILVQLGVDLNQPRGNRSALLWAVDADNLACAQLVAKHGGRANTQMLQNVRSEAMARFLVQQGVDPATRFPNGLTPLLAAIRSASPKTVKALLSVAPEVMMTDNAGNNALHRAAIYNRPDLVALLLNQGINSNTKNRAGRTALDLARLHNKPRVIEILQHLPAS